MNSSRRARTGLSIIVMHPIGRRIEFTASDGDPFPRGLDQALAELAWRFLRDRLDAKPHAKVFEALILAAGRRSAFLVRP
jgi:hypothetical protein